MMSLSPDECKWSKRLAPRQQELRCGFTGACVDACQRCKCIDLRVVRACARHSDLLEHWLLLSLQEHTLTPERRLAYLWMCIRLASKTHSFMHLRLDSRWIPADHRAVNHNVAWLSPSHSHPSDPLCLVIWLLLQPWPHWWVCSLLWLYKAATCFHKLASWTPTHAGPRSLLLKWKSSVNLMKKHSRVFGKGRSSSIEAYPPKTQASGQLFLDIPFSFSSKSLSFHLQKLI